MDYFLAISIGPVQDFIATARRSRDLWFGSWLLSELSKAAAREIAVLNGNSPDSLIFPAIENIKELDGGSSLNVANKIVATVSQSPDEVGAAAEKAVARRLDAIAEDTFRHIGGAFDRDAARSQIRDLVEFYWAAVAFEDEDYTRIRERADALLTARKTTRDFRSVRWGSRNPKSSLDGLRESVMPESVYNEFRDKPSTLRNRYGIRPGERLCGIGLLKRNGKPGEGIRFLSTSHVAALPLLRGMPEHARSLARDYIDTLKGLGFSEDQGRISGPPHPVFGSYDGHLLFKERLREFFDEDSTVKIAEKALEKFLGMAARDPLAPASPDPYYAVLLADGDRMGQIISGIATAKGHRDLSRRLSAFARQAKDIIGKHEGSALYAGGDDVLALLPLHTALRCARELSREFSEALDDVEAGPGKASSMSVGIVVAHHMEPFSDTLDLARKTEKTAKSVPGKNALAVTVSKRSGSDRTISGRFADLTDRLSHFIRYNRQEWMSERFAYELRDLYLHLTKTIGNPPLHDPLHEAVRYEAVRILKRKRAEHGDMPVPDDVLKYLEQCMDSDGESLSRLADEIVIARVFAEAKDMAGLPQEEL